MENTTTSQQGGICNANVQCPPGSSSSLVVSNNISWKFDKKSENIKDFEIEDEKQQRSFYLFNLNEQLVSIIENISDLQNQKMELPSGLYILREISKNQIVSSKKLFVNN